jgi:GAF domain-containing protein
VTSARVEEILAEVVEGSTPAADAPQRLVRACTRALPVTGVGLILMTDAGPAGTVAASDGPASTMEDLQFTLGEGPCVECSTIGRPVLQPDLLRTGPERWPGFSAGALEAGIRAIFAFPLRMGGIRLGVLDIYRDTAGELSGAQLAEALSFADAATALLLHLQARQSADGSGPGAIPVLEDRAEVHQATGVISVQADVSMAEALVRLRARAYASDRPILQVARDVLSGDVDFGLDYHGR